MCSRPDWFELIDDLEKYSWNPQTNDWAPAEPTMLGAQLLDFIRRHLLTEETV